ncbi:MAG: ATP-binding protein, partial [Myxococcota bacterium]
RWQGAEPESPTAAAASSGWPVRPWIDDGRGVFVVRWAGDVLEVLDIAGGAVPEEGSLQGGSRGEIPWRHGDTLLAIAGDADGAPHALVQRGTEAFVVGPTGREQRCRLESLATQRDGRKAREAWSLHLLEDAGWAVRSPRSVRTCDGGRWLETDEPIAWHYWARDRVHVRVAGPGGAPRWCWVDRRGARCDEPGATTIVPAWSTDSGSDEQYARITHDPDSPRGCFEVVGAVGHGHLGPRGTWASRLLWFSDDPTRAGRCDTAPTSRVEYRPLAVDTDGLMVLRKPEDNLGELRVLTSGYLGRPDGGWRTQHDLAGTNWTAIGVRYDREGLPWWMASDPRACAESAPPRERSGCETRIGMILPTIPDGGARIAGAVRQPVDHGPQIEARRPRYPNWLGILPLSREVKAFVQFVSFTSWSATGHTAMRDRMDPTSLLLFLFWTLGVVLTTAGALVLRRLRAYLLLVRRTQREGAYPAGPPVEDLRWLVDRSHAIDGIVEDLVDNGRRAITWYGPPRSGKTSVSRHVARRLREEGWLVAEVAVEVSPTPQTLTEELVAALGRECEAKGLGWPEGPLRTAVAELVARRSVLLIVDEAQHLYLDSAFDRGSQGLACRFLLRDLVQTTQVRLALCGVNLALRQEESRERGLQTGSDLDNVIESERYMDDRLIDDNNEPDRERIAEFFRRGGVVFGYTLDADAERHLLDLAIQREGRWLAIQRIGRATLELFLRKYGWRGRRWSWCWWWPVRLSRAELTAVKDDLGEPEPPNRGRCPSCTSRNRTISWRCPACPWKCDIVTTHAPEQFVELCPACGSATLNRVDGCSDCEAQTRNQVRGGKRDHPS